MPARLTNDPAEDDSPSWRRCDFGGRRWVLNGMHWRAALPFLALLSSLVGACTSPLSPREALELNRAEARWAARPFRAYSYEIATACGECPALMRQLVRVSVEDDHVVGGVLVASDSALPPGALTSFTTVDGLFARIRGYQHQDWLQDVIVTFDPQLGYPRSIDVFARTGIMDADYGQFTQNLRPTP